jgi:hypothetical protein
MEFPHYKNETTVIAAKTPASYDPESELTGIDRMAKFAKSFSARKGRKIMTIEVTNHEATWFTDNAEKHPYDNFYILTKYENGKLNVVDLIHSADAENMFPRIGVLRNMPLSPDKNHIAIKHLFRNVKNVHVIRPEIPDICIYLKKTNLDRS